MALHKQLRWQRRYDGVLRLVLTEPHLTRKQIAERTGYGETQISRITNSPCFKERYVRARAVVEKELARRYVERLEVVNVQK